VDPSLEILVPINALTVSDSRIVGIPEVGQKRGSRKRHWKPQSFCQQNQQLDLAGGCNAVIPRDFVVWGSCSTPTAPTNYYPLLSVSYGKFKGALRGR